ncbi:hypothetical protein GCM10029976_014800 [Kribbella albertanoniae]|uniref:DUF3137 domain-containing protein n=1 Tax=Kribbella albertanoniae TaxID=1266829 RepID=A0A4R4PKY5_9ACTN|nr:hypothetical protein [Kribbella albertanoniae]TDC22609.1 hypothetical protein E1261_30495 [Kribbella albertanoniae]
MHALDVPTWLEALVGMQLGAALFIGFIALVGWLIAHLAGPWLDREEAQLKRLQAGAERYGWLPAEDTDGRLAAAGARCFEDDGTLQRLLVGSYEGRRIQMAGFATLGSGPTAMRNLVAIELPVSLPELRISHDGVTPPSLPPLEPVLQMSDTESDAFNQRYFAASLDPRYTSAMLHPRMIEWILAHPPQDLRLVGNLLIAYTPKPWTVPHTLATVPLLSGIVDRIPPFVLKDFGDRSVS